ncbi:metal-dependent hydrolase, beta-lactamase superfamily III [Beggiatoa alba B18LD]|uniref:Metal-dependent hydrolase, beta-lactamase superfamily III n=1 Tax=Beggiatoa alba B18LD TaxID=395493 RepID=I3CKQ6_9GAMM|nr:MBL fold metallo-hydrolase [Beggiatoa alba]EIJ44199.1 metal-dependent hydrolase, beta-lactamase superfamily III [Beggiatoa alba B18LD]
MKITAIGVNAAFSTGEYEDGLSVQDVRELILELRKTSTLRTLSEAELTAQLTQRSKRFYNPKWHSNFLIEFDMPSKRGSAPYRLLVDMGGDARHALKALHLSSTQIDGVYISHPHNDHIGGMECIALTTLFNPNYTQQKKAWLNGMFIADKLFHEQTLWANPPSNTKPDLFIHKKVLEPLRRAVGPGLDTVQGVPNVNLETYFDIHLVGKQEDGRTVTHTFQDGEESWVMTPVFAMHVFSSSEEMPSYGISLQHTSGYNVLMPTDIQFMIPPQLEMHYRKADRIYMDCETSSFPSGVHPHISDLIKHLDPEIQKKCLLYHYDAYPVVPDGMFFGILNAGDNHIYPPPKN